MGILAYWKVIAFGILIAALGIQTYRVQSGKLAMTEHLKEDAIATSAAIAQAKALGDRVTSAVNDAATQYEKGKADAEQIKTSVTSQLNAGTIRVRTIWKCPPVSGHLPETPAASSEPSTAEQQRNDSAGRIIGAAHSCDAQVEALQKVYNDARALINGP